MYLILIIHLIFFCVLSKCLFCLCSLGPELLLCILEIIDEPIVSKNGIFSEKDFKQILDWCDVWIILFKANGMPLLVQTFTVLTEPCLDSVGQ